MSKQDKIDTIRYELENKYKRYDNLDYTINELEAYIVELKKELKSVDESIESYIVKLNSIRDSK